MAKSADRIMSKGVQDANFFMVSVRSCRMACSSVCMVSTIIRISSICFLPRSIISGLMVLFSFL